MSLRENACMVISAVSILLLTSSLTHAQGICIPEPIKVSQVRGHVLSGPEEDRSPLEAATVKVLELGTNHVLLSTTTDKSGQFHIQGLKAGKYALQAEHPAASSIAVEMTVTTPRQSSKRNNRLIEFVLGADPTKDCWGGTVVTVEPRVQADRERPANIRIVGSTSPCSSRTLRKNRRVSR